MGFYVFVYFSFQKGIKFSCKLFFAHIYTLVIGEHSHMEVDEAPTMNVTPTVGENMDVHMPQGRFQLYYKNDIKFS